MKSGNYRLVLLFLALALTAGHLVRASEVKFLFSDRSDNEYVKVTTIQKTPARFRLSRCVEKAMRFETGVTTEPVCTPFGKKEGYSVEEIRTRAYRLSDKRIVHGLTQTETRTVDTLLDLVDGIERPRIHFENRSFTYNVKGNVDQFVQTVEKHLN